MTSIKKVAASALYNLLYGCCEGGNMFFGGIPLEFKKVESRYLDSLMLECVLK